MHLVVVAIPALVPSPSPTTTLTRSCSSPASSSTTLSPRSSSSHPFAASTLWSPLSKPPRLAIVGCSPADLASWGTAGAVGWPLQLFTESRCMSLPGGQRCTLRPRGGPRRCEAMRSPLLCPLVQRVRASWSLLDVRGSAGWRCRYSHSPSMAARRQEEAHRLRVREMAATW